MADGLHPEGLGAAPEETMSVTPRAGNAKITVPSILSRKTHSPSGSPSTEPKITCISAYDYPTARLLDEASVDILLVGDSLGMVALGYESTLPVTLDEMLHHVRAVRRGLRHALLVADMPYGSFHVSNDESVRNAMRLVKEGGAEAVKVEGGERRIELIARLVEAEIPVMGHVGLTPQSVNTFGGYSVQGKTADAARQIERDARAVEAAGAFAVVLESVPRELAARITEKLRIPTIGIGAGPDCDGQVLVFHDLVGFAAQRKPKFVRQYANLSAEISRAVTEYCDDVRSGRFPSDAESYHSATEITEHLPVRERTFERSDPA
jgi:3-methyl-2-oxobutanoate hydroxymethyltransferase